MAGNLESQVSVLCLNPTGVAASISGGILRCDRASGDPVEKQVFADRPDRGTTAAVGGKGSFAPVPVSGGNAPEDDIRRESEFLFRCYSDPRCPWLASGIPARPYRNPPAKPPTGMADFLAQIDLDVLYNN